MFFNLNLKKIIFWQNFVLFYIQYLPIKYITKHMYVHTNNGSWEKQTKNNKNFKGFRGE